MLRSNSIIRDIRQTGEHAVPFTIVGYDRQRLVSRTRVAPAGAIVLARRWLERGFTRVRIERDGRFVEPSEFCSQFTLTRTGMKPRSGLRSAIGLRVGSE